MENINNTLPEEKMQCFGHKSMPGIYVHSVYLLDLNQQLETETLAVALSYKSFKLRVYFVNLPSYST